MIKISFNKLDIISKSSIAKAVSNYMHVVAPEVGISVVCDFTAIKKYPASLTKTCECPKQ